MAASLPSPGVCVLSLAAAQPRVDAAVLEASGLRVRTVSTCVADVMLTSASLAMLVLPAADLEQGASCWDRIGSLARRGFRSAVVIVHGRPSQRLQQRILKESSRFLGKPMFMEVPADLALTKFVLEVINSSVGENSDGVAEQRALTVASPAAVVHALMRIPEAQITEPQAQAMRGLGSMQDIVASGVEDLMCCADLTQMQYANLQSQMAPKRRQQRTLNLCESRL